MPELPEIETIVRDLNDSKIPGSKIESVQVFWKNSISFLDSDHFCKDLSDQKIQAVTRRGKYLVFVLSEKTLLIHLRMTGKLILNNEQKIFLHERVQWKLEDGRFLHFIDQRKFGKLILTHDPEIFFANLGPEPLSPEFNWETFAEKMKKRKVSIKSFLLDQKSVSGLGNIYVDESLWLSKIYPGQFSNTLSCVQIKLLHEAIISVLSHAIQNRGSSLGVHLGNYSNLHGAGSHQLHHHVFRKENTPCPRCRAHIKKIRVAQRGTHFCPVCQKN